MDIRADLTQVCRTSLTTQRDNMVFVYVAMQLLWRGLGVVSLLSLVARTM
jgi:hypothetical protein